MGGRRRRIGPGEGRTNRDVRGVVSYALMHGGEVRARFEERKLRSGDHVLLQTQTMTRVLILTPLLDAGAAPSW